MGLINADKGTMDNSTETAEQLQHDLNIKDIVVLIIGAAIIVSNSALIWHFIKSRNLVRSTFLFLSNLAASDILTGILGESSAANNKCLRPWSLIVILWERLESSTLLEKGN